MPRRRAVLVVKTIDELLASDTYGDQCRLARHPDCPRDWLEDMLHTPRTYADSWLGINAWMNPSLTRQQYEEGVRIINENPVDDGLWHYTRMGLIDNTGLPSDLILTVNNKFFRLHHPNTPLEEIRRILAAEPHYSRATYARQRNIPQAIQFDLTRDPDPKVRNALARNRNLLSIVVQDWYPREPRIPILRALAKNRAAAPYREIILVRLTELSQQRGITHSRATRNTVARYSENPVIVGSIIAGTTDEQTLRIALRNKNADPNALTTVAIGHRDHTIRDLAVKNPNCPEEGLVGHALRACSCGHPACRECRARR